MADDLEFQVVRKRKARKPKPMPLLSDDSKPVMEKIKDCPGITVRKIYESLDGVYVSSRTGGYLTLQQVGDIVYDELLPARRVQPVGKHPTTWHAT